MKSFVCILLFCSALSIYAQEAPTNHLLLSPGNCRANWLYSPSSSDSIRIYAMPKDSLVTIVVPGHYRQFPIQLDLPASLYRIAYKNDFGQRAVKTVALFENDPTYLNLCTDSLLSYTSNSLAKLKDKDSLVVTFQSWGCFNDNHLKIVILKNGERFIASLYRSQMRYIDNKGKTSSKIVRKVLLKTKNLSKEDLLPFIRFENELLFAHPDGCTTTDLYGIKSRYVNLTREDGTCRWHGFYFLSKSWFGIYD